MTDFKYINEAKQYFNRTLQHAKLKSDTYTTLRPAVFNGFSSLESVDHIPVNTTNMHMTFRECKNLKTIPDSIPNGVVNMTYTFFNCYNLTKCPKLPNSVNMMYYAFGNCRNMSFSTEIPNSAVNIGYAFLNCHKLENAVVPASVNSMPFSFYYCNSLKNVSILTNSVTSLYYTFGECKNLVNVPTLPNSLTSISSTFSGCSNLVNAPVIPNSVLDMGHAFSSCLSLTTAPRIPSNVRNMAYSFWNCVNLTGDIYIESENVSNVSNMFARYNNASTPLPKTVHIPYYYENGEPTNTYIAFQKEGYLEDNSEGISTIDIYDVELLLHATSGGFDTNKTKVFLGSHELDIEYITEQTLRANIRPGTVNITVVDPLYKVLKKQITVSENNSSEEENVALDNTNGYVISFELDEYEEYDISWEINGDVTYHTNSVSSLMFNAHDSLVLTIKCGNGKYVYTNDDITENVSLHPVFLEETSFDIQIKDPFNTPTDVYYLQDLVDYDNDYYDTRFKIFEDYGYIEEENDWGYRNVIKSSFGYSSNSQGYISFTTPPSEYSTLTINGYLEKFGYEEPDSYDSILIGLSTDSPYYPDMDYDSDKIIYSRDLYDYERDEINISHQLLPDTQYYLSFFHSYYSYGYSTPPANFCITDIGFKAITNGEQ